MPSQSYTDPRLVAVYDILNPPAEDSAFYLDLAGHAPLAILDVGCGTGGLACDLAGRGHRVTGADPAAAMLALARRRPGGDKVSWVESDAAGLALAARFDLIIMTGHAFQVLLDDTEVGAALSNLRRLLAPGGRLAFETRNPEVAEWAEWTPELTRERLQVPGIGSVDVHYDIRSVAGPRVIFETHYRFSDSDVVVALNTLRFMGRDELAGVLAAIGFGDIAWYGDWDRSPPGADKPEIIVIAR